MVSDLIYEERENGKNGDYEIRCLGRLLFGLAEETDKVYEKNE